MKDLFNTSKYKVVTFDVFDTLVIRNAVKPVDVFDIVGGRLFRYVRIVAEIASRRLSREEDITLDEIYRFLPDKLKEKELAAELAVCKVNPEVYPLYKELKAQGKKIYAISDMYLPREVIEQILKNCGYELDGVYVSSDIKLSKTTGNLFKYFLREHNLKPDEVLHIGDNEVADIECAEQVGINTYHIEKHYDKLTYLKRNKDLVLRGFVNHKLNSLEKRSEQIGYEVLGPVLVSFCQWIHSQNKKFGFDKLFFLSRDMHIVYDVYKMIYGGEGVEYLHISRNSLHSAKADSTGLCAYLKKTGCIGNVAVIDTGWRCAAQPIIEHYARIVEPSSDIGGLYMGAKTGFNYIPRSAKSASCFYRTRLELIKAQTYSSFIECMLGKNEDKVIGYDAEGVPVFKTIPKRTNNITQVQSSALRFVSDWISETDNRRIKSKDAISAYIRMQNYPLGSDIALLGDEEYDDELTTGVVSYNTGVLDNPLKWLGNIRFSAWKGAYFKRSFKFYIPFYYGYLLMNSLRMSFVDITTFKGKDINFLLDYYK